MMAIHLPLQTHPFQQEETKKQGHTDSCSLFHNYPFEYTASLVERIGIVIWILTNVVQHLSWNWGSWGYWRKSRNSSDPCPCVIAPVKCVRRCHKLTVLLLTFFKCGRLVADWSMPSIIRDSIEESILALDLISWYLAHWSLQNHNQFQCYSNFSCSNFANFSFIVVVLSHNAKHLHLDGGYSHSS